MSKLDTELITVNTPEVTPSEFSDFLPDYITPAQTIDCILTTRVAMVQNLLTVSEVITKSFSNSTDIKTQLELADKLRKTYNDIGKLLTALEENIVESTPESHGLNFSREASPFLDYRKRKKRSDIWNDYVAWCKMKELAPTKKGMLFEELRRHGFKESVTNGSITLVPPGVR